MLTVFIDTNIYKEENYNFDERNEVFKSFLELVRKKEIKNIGRFVIISKDKDVIKSFETLNKDCFIVLKSIKELLELVENYGQERKL